MAELNDMQALSYLESMANAVRAFKHLEDVVRYVRNARLDLPKLREEIESLTAQRADLAARRSGEEKAFEAERKERRKKVQNMAEVEAQQAETVRKLEQKEAQLSTRKEHLERDVASLTEERIKVERIKEALIREAQDLTSKVSALKEELEGLKTRTAAVLGG